MKIYEIITEDAAKKLSKTSREAASYAKQLHVDQYYGMYRFGIAMAGEPEHSAPKEGPAKDMPTVWMYTDAEIKKVDGAAKNQGIKSTTIVAKGPSSEIDIVNTTSPVAKPKRNKYGV
jgi:hypothetical protein